MKLDRFITRPVLSTVISILVVILGVLGLVSLPIEQYPNMAPPTIMVRAAYTGANSQTVLNSVLAPLEESINGVEGMTYMTSSATNDGSASVLQPTTTATTTSSSPTMPTSTSFLPSNVSTVWVSVSASRRRTTPCAFGLTP